MIVMVVVVAVYGGVAGASCCASGLAWPPCAQMVGWRRVFPRAFFLAITRSAPTQGACLGTQPLGLVGILGSGAGEESERFPPLKGEAARLSSSSSHGPPPTFFWPVDPPISRPRISSR